MELPYVKAFKNLLRYTLNIGTHSKAEKENNLKISGALAQSLLTYQCQRVVFFRETLSFELTHPFYQEQFPLEGISYYHSLAP